MSRQTRDIQLEAAEINHEARIDTIKRKYFNINKFGSPEYQREINQENNEHLMEKYRIHREYEKGTDMLPPDLLGKTPPPITPSQPFTYTSGPINPTKPIPQKTNYNWVPDYPNHRGDLYIQEEKTQHFSGATFGGIDFLLKNMDHEVKRSELRTAMYSHSRKKKTNPKNINTSKWTSDLKAKRRIFQKYFKIKFIEPDIYEIVYVGT